MQFEVCSQEKNILCKVHTAVSAAQYDSLPLPPSTSLVHHSHKITQLCTRCCELDDTITRTWKPPPPFSLPPIDLFPSYVCPLQPHVILILLLPLPALNSADCKPEHILFSDSVPFLSALQNQSICCFYLHLAI